MKEKEWENNHQSYVSIYDYAMSNNTQWGVRIS